VAVATGGSCTFSVNGAAKGTGTSTKVQLAPGAYSVACKPSGGSAKSRSVTIKSGETSMVSFKL
jgi:serine/threonine-protein kinase